MEILAQSFEPQISNHLQAKKDDFIFSVHKPRSALETLGWVGLFNPHTILLQSPWFCVWWVILVFSHPPLSFLLCFLNLGHVGLKLLNGNKDKLCKKSSAEREGSNWPIDVKSSCCYFCVVWVYASDGNWTREARNIRLYIVRSLAVCERAQTS